MRNHLQKPYSIFLETSKPNGENQKTLLFQEPENIIEAKSLSDVHAALEQIDDAHRRGKWLAGYIGYEAGFAFEKKLYQLPVGASLPLLWFGEYDAPQLNPSIQFNSKHSLAQCVAFNFSKKEYANAVDKILDYIQAGDVYQVNLTGKITFYFQGDAVELYESLREKQSVAYAAFLNLGEKALVSFSPELFFRISNGVIESKPMKGTAPRGRTTAEDEAAAMWLKADEKNRAENLMILDLIRNDFGRICKTGSISVPSLFDVERFQTLFQMTSTVRGELEGDITFREIFEAIFPCGSITGAPKIRAMQIISELETMPRGVYTGAIGFISPQKEACFSVAIRTLVVENENQSVETLVGEMGIGSGVTIDSESQTEYDECLLKANFLTKPTEDIALIESIKFQGHYCLLDKHILRLKNSVEYFDFELDELSLRAMLTQYAKLLHDNAPYKVRVVLEKSGRVELSHERIEPMNEIGKVAIAETRTNSADKFFYHKTTKRQIYDEASGLARRLGLADFIFLNERGEVSEGAISSVWVEKVGRLYTPPISSGILAGVYRTHVLETHRNASECVIRIDDLRNADRLWICNAVRGMREVRLVKI